MLKKQKWVDITTLSQADVDALVNKAIRCFWVRPNGVRCRRVAYGVKEPWRCGQHDPKTMWHKLTFNKLSNRRRT